MLDGRFIVIQFLENCFDALPRFDRYARPSIDYFGDGGWRSMRNFGYLRQFWSLRRFPGCH